MSSLPDAPEKAIKFMIQKAETLAEVLERENMALARNDAVSFAIAQQEKEHLAAEYETLAAAFAEKRQALLGANTVLLDRLEKAQQDLKSRAEDNTAMMERMQKKA